VPKCEAWRPALHCGGEYISDWTQHVACKGAQTPKPRVIAAARCPIDLEHARTASLKSSMMLSEPAQHHPAIDLYGSSWQIRRDCICTMCPMVITMLHKVIPGTVDANTLLARVPFFFLSKLSSLGPPLTSPPIFLYSTLFLSDLNQALRQTRDKHNFSRCKFVTVS
jgi:hypothetical protein